MKLNKRYFGIFLGTWCFFAQWQIALAETEITLEKVMSDPDWIGNAPENAFWSGDGQSVLYWKKKKGSEQRELFQYFLDTNKTQKIELNEWSDKAQSQTVYDKARSLKARLYHNNIIVENIKTGKVRRFTDDNEQRSQLQFLNDGRLSFRQHHAIKALNLKSGLISTLVNIKLEKDPRESSDSDTFLAAQQDRLFEYIREEKKKKMDRFEHQLDQIHQGGFGAVDWFLGKDRRLQQLSLSPNGQWAIAVTSEETKPKRDTMPEFVTETGYVNNIDLRPKVGFEKSSNEEIWLLDLKTNEKDQLALSTLPSFNKDRLKKLRKQNAPNSIFKREAVIFDWMNQDAIQWSPNGQSVAFTLMSVDNKDRWIVGVNFKKKKLVSYEHLYDEAWVNDFAFNEFAWVNNHTLYYLSEQSGYSHLYTYTKGKRRQITRGDYEVREIKASDKGEYFYFVANKEHPGIYEVYRVAIQGGPVERLTTKGGMNRFLLSPDESKLLLTNSQLTRPNELFVQQVGKPQTRKQITATVSKAFSSISWTKPSIVAIASEHSELPIYGRLYKPQGKDLKKAVMFVHGAGYLQNVHYGWSSYFREFMFHSLLTRQGYTVLDLDYRASKGYGRDWRTAIYRQMGTPELEDYIVGSQWLVEEHGINADKIGIYGGSYGGFMTFMALFKAPNVFAAGAALRPVTDWAHYNHGYTSNILNTPEIDPESYLKSSPIEFAEGLEDPLLICHGMVDDNVVFQDSVRLVQRLIELKKENFELAVYPIEPHGFKQPSSWLDEYRRIYKLFESSL